MHTRDQKRLIRIITQSIAELQLNLAGLRVLTECGSDLFAITPLIAAMAGASKVFCWTRDSAYGRAEDNIRLLQEITEAAGIRPDFDFSIDARPPAHIRQSHIITNSGFVRPLDRHFLQHIDPRSCAIPLMYESWEVRPEDIDLAFCRERNIRVAGIWENYPGLNIFDYCGPLSLKLALEAGYEVYRNKIIVWSDDPLGKTAADAFDRAGADLVIMTTCARQVYAHANEVDFIFFCNYSDKRTVLGAGGMIDLPTLRSINPSLGLVHLAGMIDLEAVVASGLLLFPPQAGHSQRMTRTLAHCGPSPLIKLQAAALRTGEEMVNDRISALTQPLTF